MQKKLERFMARLRKGPLLPKMLFLLSCVVLLALCRYIFTAGNLWIHSDIASTVTLANEMIKTGQLFPTGWRYGTAISLVPFPTALFLKMGADYILAHNITQLLFTALMLISIILFSKKFFHNNSWLLMVPLLFTNISADQYEMFFIQSAYTGMIFIMFFSLVCFAEASELEPTVRMRRGRAFLFLLYIVFSALLGSVFLQMVTLPLCGALIICGVMDARSHIREIKGHIYLCSVIFAVSVLGCILFSLLCSQIHILGNSGLTTFRGSYAEIIENISITVQAVLFNIGISGNASIFSLQGIANVLRIILAGAVWVVFPLLAFRNIRNEPVNVRIFLVFSILHIAEVLIMLLFCNSGVDYIANSRYQLASLTLLSTISSYYVYEHFIKKTCLIGWVYSLALVAICLVLTIPVVNISGWQEELSNMRGITDYLDKHGLHYGYATFWNAGKNTVLSDGKVQINQVRVGEKLIQIDPILSSDDWYDPLNYEGKTFLLLTDDEAATFAPDGYDKTQVGPPEAVLNYPPYTVLVYDYNISKSNFSHYVLSGGVNLLEMAACSDATMHQENGEILIQEGQVMYGPYIPLDAGEYALTIEALLGSPTEIVVTADFGGKILETYKLASGTNEFQFKLEENQSQVEFVVCNQNPETICIAGLHLLLKDDGGGT